MIGSDGTQNNFEIGLCGNTTSGPQQNGFISVGYIISLSFGTFYLFFFLFLSVKGTITYLYVGLVESKYNDVNCTESCQLSMLSLLSKS